ncbi:MAG: hypothetical protein M1360_01745 [Candidatus Marsarchaeota archaeon]|jgi:hypothetical protein|nr:hypothetical protein [Candidatus Marsarchaeota archaeon]MCL5418644.1 hypothetical protein [Candidatus Marsarchaeota archaeon]
MPRRYRISKGDDFIIVTVDDSGAYIIQDNAGRKVFLSRYQAKLMKFGIDNILGGALGDTDTKDVKIEEIKDQNKDNKDESEKR